MSIFAAALRQNSSIRSFKFRPVLRRKSAFQDVRTECFHTSMVALSRALMHCTTLKRLELRCPDVIGNEFGKALAEALRQNSSLEEIKLSCGSASMDDESGVA